MNHTSRRIRQPRVDSQGQQIRFLGLVLLFKTNVNDASLSSNSVARIPEIHSEDFSYILVISGTCSHFSVASFQQRLKTLTYTASVSLLRAYK